MLTKTRSIVIAGLASLSFGAATVAPAVSQAQAISPQAKAISCEILRSAGKAWQELGEAAERRGDSHWADYYFRKAEEVAGEAGNLGCLWEIEIDVTKAAPKVKGIQAPGAAAPVVKAPVAAAPVAAATTSGSVTVPSAR